VESEENIEQEVKQKKIRLEASKFSWLQGWAVKRFSAMAFLVPQ
jgi:hypothetical protein